MLRGGQDLLLPGLGGEQQVDFGNRQVGERVARELQVADVDRIEAPTKDPDGIHAAHAHSRGRRKSV